MSKVHWVTRDGRRIAVDDNTAALLDCLEGQHEALLARLRALAQPSEAAQAKLERLGVTLLDGTAPARPTMEAMFAWLAEHGPFVRLTYAEREGHWKAEWERVADALDGATFVAPDPYHALLTLYENVRLYVEGKTERLPE